MNKISIAQVSILTDKEKLIFLKNQWNIPEDEDIRIVGKLSARYNEKLGHYFYNINDIASVNGKILEYPLTDLEENQTIASNGMFARSTFNEELKKVVNEGGEVKIKCALKLAPSKEREKHNNPVSLNAVPKTIEILYKINDADIIRDEGGSILIEKSIINSIAIKRKKEIDDDAKNHRKLAEKKQLEYLETKRKTLYTEKMALEKTIAVDTENLDILEDKCEKQKKYNADKEDEYNVLLENIQKKEEDEKSLEMAVLALKLEIEIEKEEHMKNLEMFQSFIKKKADLLLSLEFISQEQHDVLMEKYHFEGNDNEKFIDFKEDLNGNYSKAISHIQAHLYGQHIIYPKYILEDYFSLLQTNDLIILAGDSGSGKTNLVKSFAEAVGGISKIIPVKPNWTSSEDLLGYYNPLEKKYLTTPFLDALIEASHNPTIPYFICLDEMNLARVEYYFAEFLSVLEERNNEPIIYLYSDTESGHVLSEFSHVLEAIKFAKEKSKKNIINYIDILKDEKVNNELKRIFGFSDKDSLIKYHSDLRKMISGILNVPSSIIFPNNVRIIGAINIDETTHYLSPKILDRAHVMKFDNPLLYDSNMISDEIDNNIDATSKIKFSIEDFGTRCPYPKFDSNGKFCETMVGLTKKYFIDLGVDVGFRTIRQGLNYQNMLTNCTMREDVFMNNFILHKILPKFTFDGSSEVGGKNKIDVLKDFKEELQREIGNELLDNDARSAINELASIINKSPENDGIVNYWA